MSILDEREKTHGSYANVARVSQHLKTYIHNEGARLTPEQRESLDMICVKIARIVCGNPNEPDHWIDISGYAELIHKRQATLGELTKQEPPKDEIQKCPACNNWRDGSRCLKLGCPGWGTR